MTDVVELELSVPTSATLKRYGLTLEDWREILDRQGGVCAICKKLPGPAKNTGKIRMVIDHEHVRGWKNMPPAKRKLYVRGLCCWWCNASYLGRSITAEKARNMAVYLDQHAERLALALGAEH